MKKFVPITQVFIALGMFLGVTSCTSLSTISVEVMKPATYSVAPQIISVLVVDNSYPSVSDSANRVNLLGKRSTIDSVFVNDFGLRATESMAYELDQRAFFDSIFFHPHSLNRPNDGIPLPELSLESIDSLLNIYNANAIISLEDFRYNSLIKVSNYADSYYVTLDTDGTLFWKFYDADGYILDTYLQRDSIFWSDVILKQNNSPIVIPDLRDALQTLADFMGRNYPNRVSPSWKLEDRNFFMGGHYLFSRATDLAKINNWNEAAKVWYYVYENGTAKQKAMAAFNLALSFEMRSDFDEALAWADISKKSFSNLKFLQSKGSLKNRATLYYLRLQERLNEQNKLNEQFGASN